MKNIIDNRAQFLNALESLAAFRSTLIWDDNPAAKELQAEFDKGFLQLRDTFQPKMEKIMRETAR